MSKFREYFDMSLNEKTNKKSLKVFDEASKYFQVKKNSVEMQFIIKELLKVSLTEANFHSESKMVDKIFTKAKPLAGYKKFNNLTNKEMIITDQDQLKSITDYAFEYGDVIAKYCKWDGFDIMDTFAEYSKKNFNDKISDEILKLKDL